MVVIKSFLGFAATFLATTLAASIPATEDLSRSSSSSSSSANADPKVGYFGVVFKDQDEQVDAILSNGDSAIDFSLVNKGQPILTSSLGSGHIRDPFLVQADGVNYIIATDNSLKAFSGDDGFRTASRKITVWKSKGDSLTQWEQPYLTDDLVPERFGSVSAPEAVYIPDKKQWFVHFTTSEFLSVNAKKDKTVKTRPASIYGMYTSDFKTFEGTATPYYDTPDAGGVSDMTIAPLSEDGKCFVRFFRDDTKGTLKVRGQVTQEGIFGQWKDIGGATHYLDSNNLNGGPLIFKDLNNPHLFHIWIDDFTMGYHPFTATDGDFTKGNYQKTDAPGFLQNLKQGSIIAISQKQHDEVAKAQWQ